MRCDRDPAAFRTALRDTAQRYHRVAVVKYWHTCCDRCLASPPVWRVESKMTLADVTSAHGMSLQGSIRMLKSLPNDGNADMTNAIHTLTRSVVYATADTPAHVIEFTKFLSKLYNTTCRLDNGTVMHILTTDSPPFRVNLQGMLFVRESDLREERKLENMINKLCQQTLQNLDCIHMSPTCSTYTEAWQRRSERCT